MSDLDFDLDSFTPDRRALFDRLRREVDEPMLRAIANADYGCDAEKHYAPLATMHATGDVPANLDWQPYEVLQLTRWIEPDDPASKPFLVRRRGHLARLFATTILLRAAAEGGRFDSGDDDSDVVQASASVQRLEPAYADDALGLFAWYGSRASYARHAQFSAVLGIVSIWPFVSEPIRSKNSIRKLFDRLQDHPSLDDYLRRCFSLGRFQLAIESAAEQARRRFANGEEIPRKASARLDALATRVRDVEFPPRMPKPWD